jgi:hypothetical protein
MAQRLRFKGRAARALDAWYRHGSVEDNLTKARELLEAGDSFAAVVGRVPRKPREFKYPEQGSAASTPTFERAARDGYLRAIGLALGHNPAVPIRTTWETGRGNADWDTEEHDQADHVQVVILVPASALAAVGVGEISAADAGRLGLTDVEEVA